MSLLGPLALRYRPVFANPRQSSLGSSFRKSGSDAALAIPFMLFGHERLRQPHHIICLLMSLLRHTQRCNPYARRLTLGKFCYVRDFCSTRFSFSRPLPRRNNTPKQNTSLIVVILGRICGVVGCRFIDPSTGCASTAGWSCMGAPTVRPSLSG
jgi:hypothetical protein